MNLREGEPLLHIADLSAGYGDVKVLNNISIDVHPRETVAILGPNGHGKTTLLRSVSGLHRASSGSIRFAGTEIMRQRPSAIASLGLVQVPQGDLLFPEMTVLENLLVGAYLPESWAKRRKALELVWSIFPEIRSRRDTMARDLSGGERRMCAVGRALMGNARMLLIDEPSLGLAPIAIEHLYTALTSLKHEGMTILLVEEAAERVQSLAERVYLLDTGRIVYSGSTQLLLSDRALMDTYLG